MRSIVPHPAWTFIQSLVTPAAQPDGTHATLGGMSRTFLGVALACLVGAGAGAAQPDQSSAVYRYRSAIAALMQLKPGMTAAEVGATPGVLGPEMKLQVGADGKSITATLDRQTAATNLAPASVDAVAVLSTLTVVQQPQALFAGMAKAVKPGGVMLVVDVPQENDGKRVVGLEADDVVTLATAAGFKREAESGIVPGHYAIRFRKVEGSK
jgi:hypothetical protein